jgi:hypothetical protein
MSDIPIKIEIDLETANRITVANLKNYAIYLQEELDNYKQGSWPHPTAIEDNTRRIVLIKELLRDFEDC